MIKKSTEDLFKQLTSKADLDSYIKTNKELFLDFTVCELLNSIINEKGLVKSKIFKRAEINEIYGYQILSGSRIPSRDKLIALSIGMNLNLKETQVLLKCSKNVPLYPKIKRDSIIISGINNNQSVFEINGLLYKYGEDTL